MITKATRSILVALLAATGAATYAGTADADPIQRKQVLVLFDRSGSMRHPGSCGGGLTKAQCAMNTLRDVATAVPTSPLAPFLQDENAGDVPSDYFFWGFRTRAGETDYIVNYAGAVVPAVGFAGMDGFGNVLNSIAAELDPAGSDPPIGNDFTPLAQAYCRAVDFLRARPVDEVIPNELHILLVSDGYQEPTVASALPNCDGPDNGAENEFQPPPIHVTRVGDALFATGTDYTAVPPTPFASGGLWVNSWQANMLDKAISGVLHLPASPDWASTYPFPQIPPEFGPAFQPLPSSQNVIVEVRFIEQFTGIVSPFGAAASSDAAGDGEDSRGEGASLAFTPSSMADFLDFLSGLAITTGGRLVIPGRESSPEEPYGTHVLPGDADDSGCVDSADLDLVLRFFGQRISFANPESFGADVTADGAIDDRDYLLLKENYGLGCAIPPGPFPQVGSVLLGFGDPSDWRSPQGALSATTWPRTEGAFALRVGGERWREIESIPFDTSLLEGVTSQIALDLFVPGAPVNPWWLGQAQMYVSCPSANMYNVYLGAVELNGKPLDQFSRIQFPVPPQVQSVMLSSHPDFSFKIVVNSMDTGHILDNLRFVE